MKFIRVLAVLAAFTVVVGGWLMAADYGLEVSEVVFTTGLTLFVAVLIFLVFHI
jgi:hypothetical protein